MKIKIIAAIFVPLILNQCNNTNSTSNELLISPAPTSQNSSLSQKLLQDLNTHRSTKGKKPLKLSNKLTLAAQNHSNAMIQNNKLSVANTDTQPFIRTAQAVAAFGDHGNTTQKFINHWEKTSSDLILGDWSALGMGVQKNQDNLVYVTLFFGGN